MIKILVFKIIIISLLTAFAGSGCVSGGNNMTLNESSKRDFVEKVKQIIEEGRIEVAEKIVCWDQFPVLIGREEWRAYWIYKKDVGESVEKIDFEVPVQWEDWWRKKHESDGIRYRRNPNIIGRVHLELSEGGDAHFFTVKDGNILIVQPYLRGENTENS